MAQSDSSNWKSSCFRKRFTSSKNFLAYVAGLFDGEGCIRISENKVENRYTRFTLTCRIGQTYNIIPLLLIKEMWKGRLRKEKNKRKYMYTLTSGRAEKFLTDILPFLIVKRDQALLALKFKRYVKTSRRQPRSLERTEIYRKIKELMSKMKREYHESY